jgi:mono/diheme cytochrome c family protein
MSNIRSHPHTMKITRKYKLISTITLILTAIIIYSCKTQFATAPTNFKATYTEEAVERGKVLVFSSCAGCHYDRTVNKLIGTPIHDVPGIVGKVYSANLTQSKTHGRPPQYTDAQLKYLLKTGINKDGRFIPYMLRPNMADEDVNAIIAYLRSNDHAVAAADTTIGLTHYNIIGKIYMSATAKPLPYNPGIKLPTDNVAMGKYLVDNLGCFHCHSQSLQKLNYLDIEQSKGYMAGGIKFKDDKGNTVIASNITADKNTGIGGFTKSQFLKAVKDGEAPDRKLHPPMPKFDRLSDKEIDAVYSYLLTLPAQNHNVKG